MHSATRRLGWVGLLFLFMIICACGDGGGNKDNNGPDVQSLCISGTPPAYAVVGRPYNFRLTIQTDTPGTQLTFDHNLPDWAILDVSSSTQPVITGIPTMDDIGDTDVTINAYTGNIQLADSFIFTLRVIDAASVTSLYTGVPSPGGMVPAAIMPELPDAGNQISAFPYDPVGMGTPQWRDGPGQFWVDAGGVCDDGNNSGRGSPQAPRCTLPGIYNSTWTLSAGSQIFVVGNGAGYGDQQNINQMNFAGTADDPIWIIGISDAGTTRWENQPKLAFGRFMVGGGRFTHVVMENVHFYNSTDDFRGIYSTSDGGNPVSYLTFRHLTCSGSGTFSDGGAWSGDSRRCFSFNGAAANPIRFVVIYDSDIFGLGRWVDDVDTDVDLIGMHIQGAAYYIWYLDNRSYHIQGDSIQCSSSDQWDQEMHRRPHYIFVAGNEFYENYENAWDSKGCYHIVFSENYVHDFTNAVKEANNTAVIAADDAKSFVGGNFEWYINNRFQDVGNPFAYKGTQQDAYVYFIGNLVSNTLTGAAVQADGSCHTHNGLTTCGDGMYVAHNTVDCNRQGPAVTAVRSGTTTDEAVSAQEQNQMMTFCGNIFFDCLDAANAEGTASPHGFEEINANFNLIYNYNADFRDSTLGEVALSDYIDEQIDNLTNVDPLLTDPTGRVSGDYTLQESSAARAFVPESEIYSLFQIMYGLDIRLDLWGNTWSAGDLLNAGALQN